MISAEITLKTKDQAAKLFARLDKEIEDKVFNFGGKRSILYAYRHQKENKIYLSGDVRWALEHEDMCKLIDFLKQTVPVKDMTVVLDYEERGCEIYGKYILEDGILGDCYLSEEEIPDYPEPDPDEDEDEIDEDYMTEIRSRIEKAEPELVYDYNIEE